MGNNPARPPGRNWFISFGGFIAAFVFFVLMCIPIVAMAHSGMHGNSADGVNIGTIAAVFPIIDFACEAGLAPCEPETIVAAEWENECANGPCRAPQARSVPVDAALTTRWEVNANSAGSNAVANPTTSAAEQSHAQAGTPGQEVNAMLAGTRVHGINATDGGRRSQAQSQQTQAQVGTPGQEVNANSAATTYTGNGRVAHAASSIAAAPRCA